jgi:hypothetical protein
MNERAYIKSSYSEAGACVEASIPEDYVFIKSSYSGNQSDACVEVGTHNDNLLVRDSKFEDGEMVSASPEAFTYFVGALATEEFARF